MEYYSKKNGLLIHAATEMNLKSVGAEQNKCDTTYCVIIYMKVIIGQSRLW